MLDELEDELLWYVRLKIVLEIVIGVLYFYDFGCIYCDLKLVNVFLGEDEKKKWIIKIGDFGEVRVEYKDYLMF